MLVGDSLAEFSSLKGSISISINILGGEYPFLESMEELPESKGIIVVVWFWIYVRQPNYSQISQSIVALDPASIFNWCVFV